MYELYYNNGVSDVRFYPVINDFKIVRKRLDENPFIIRDIVDANLSITGDDFDYFETFKGSSQELSGHLIENFVGNSKTYQCFFTVNSDINYSTKFLTISLFIRDKYYNLLDNPEKNIDTEYDLKTLFTGINISVEVVDSLLASTFHLGFYLFNDILSEILSDIDSVITVNSSTYSNLISSNYTNILISSLDDFRKETTSSLTDVTEFKLSYLLEFLAENSGLNFFFYINDSNLLIIDKISNLIQGTYVIDLTSYNSTNWCEQRHKTVQFEEKLSLITYSNLFSAKYFRNIPCVFSKNKKNEKINEYNYIVDIDQFMVNSEPTSESKGGDVIVNCNVNSVNLQTDYYTNSEVNSFSTYTSNATGTTQSGTNTTGGYQFAKSVLFTASKGQKITLNWDIYAVGPNRKIEIYEVGGSVIKQFDMNDGVGVLIIGDNGNYQIRVSLNDSSTNFSISNFTAIISNYRLRSAIAESNYQNNYEFAPKHIIDNFGANFPDSEGIIDGASKIGLDKKPSEVEEIEFPYNNILDNFPFDEYIKTSISEEMIPYSIERQILSLDGKGFDKLILKKR